MLRDAGTSLAAGVLSRMQLLVLPQPNQRSTVEGGFVGIKALKAKSMEERARKKHSLIHRQAIAKLDKCRESAASGGSSKEEAIVRKESIRSQ